MEHDCINKDGRLIRLDYVLRTAAASGNPGEHNQSYQTPRPSIPFLIPNVWQLLERASVVRGCTRLRLVSGFAKLKFEEEGSLDAQDRGTLDFKVDFN